MSFALEAHVSGIADSADLKEAVKKSLEIYLNLPLVFTGASEYEDHIAKYRAQKKPFVIGVVYRNRVTCKSGEHEFTHIGYQIIVPKMGLLTREKKLS